MKRCVAYVSVAGLVSLGMIGSAAADACQTTGTLAEAVGTVLVDKGQGFAPGVVGASLKSGDKVAVQGPGSAVIDFGNERTVTVPSSTTETLRVPGCGLALDDSTGLVIGTVAVGGGIAAAIALSNEGSKNGIIFPVSP
ncbi:hypothetical protein [Ancylobacter polymorphus]|uniref:Uncharacterized protein n=1 Tax=Ancylobacter polymorphus TaxID=223390 RepID=A0A9E6ZW30_9HYPH|nr:hypothetical protein [Ancylobacter polymorphus]UOK72791.1 hypothetical protein K9D25_08855 [Ancylobacter polymorphus]